MQQSRFILILPSESLTDSKKLKLKWYFHFKLKTAFDDDSTRPQKMLLTSK